MSACGSMPAASMMRSAVTSEAEPTAPGDTRLPRRSSIEVIPVSAVVKTCVKLL
jgi:hypothetical protein